MDILLALMILFAGLEETVVFNRLPPPTPEMKQHVKNLGDNSFMVRERATAALQQEGYKALRILELNVKSNDPEVAARVQRILDAYYSVKLPAGGYPSILRMPKEGQTITWEGGSYKVDAAIRKHYYTAFFLETHPDTSSQWFEIEVARRSMEVYLKMLLRQGVPKTTVEKWLVDLAGRDYDCDPDDFQYES
jgi:hypothetical protein